MIGDHHQLPPVIKNMAFQKYSNMEQSLFTRFVRLGVPTIDLDAQGRARARWVTLAEDCERLSYDRLCLSRPCAAPSPKRLKVRAT